MEYKPPLNRPLFDISFYSLSLVGVLVTLYAYRYLPDRLVPFLTFGLLLYLGFGLPRWQGRKIALARAETAKKAEHSKWGIHSRDREGPWLNYINFTLLCFYEPCKQKYFYSEWLVIHDGMIIVNPGYSEVDRNKKTVRYDLESNRTYAWDGCTPKRWFFWFSLFGTPDGLLRLLQVFSVEKIGKNHYKSVRREVFWQQAHHASLVHDALYQYLDSIPLAKKQVDALFYTMLTECGFSRPMAFIYRMAVRFFGAGGIKENTPANNSEYSVLDLNIDR